MASGGDLGESGSKREREREREKKKREKWKMTGSVVRKGGLRWAPGT